jgi:hypothetical protein
VLMAGLRLAFGYAFLSGLWASKGFRLATCGAVPRMFFPFRQFCFLDQPPCRRVGSSADVSVAK